MLWFDVGFKRYTTLRAMRQELGRLWFDVGFKRYTTLCQMALCCSPLWFDVGIKRYTTHQGQSGDDAGCGLM